MTTFYFGQPVRIRDAPLIRRTHAGKEAIFHSYGTAANAWPNELDNCCILFGGEIWGARDDFLEPILPAGLESLDRINELYEPEPEVIRI